VNPPTAAESEELLRRAARKLDERADRVDADNHFEVGALEDPVNYSDFIAVLRSEATPDREPDTD
jgi:hypothetical protein